MEDAWFKEGIKRFNELYDLVKNNRNEPWAKKVEEGGVNKKLLNRHYEKRDTTEERRKKQ
jgi:hypothetical protein